MEDPNVLLTPLLKPRTTLRTAALRAAVFPMITGSRKLPAEITGKRVKSEKNVLDFDRVVIFTIAAMQLTLVLYCQKPEQTPALEIAKSWITRMNSIGRFTILPR